MKQFTTKCEVLLGTNVNKDNNYEFQLSQNYLAKLKIGEGITEDIMEFSLINFILKMKETEAKKLETSNFLIITHKYLYAQPNKILLSNLFNKKVIFIPIKNEDEVWSLIIIDNLERMISKCNNNSPSKSKVSKPKITYLLFDKLQTFDKEKCKNILEQLEKLALHEAGADSVKEFTLNNFNMNIVKLSRFNMKEDTGLVTAQIITNCLNEYSDIISFINTCDFEDYATEGVCLTARDQLVKEYSQALDAETTNSTRKTISFLTHINNHQTEKGRNSVSRKSVINKALCKEFFGKINNEGVGFLQNILEEVAQKEEVLNRENFKSENQRDTSSVILNESEPSSIISEKHQSFDDVVPRKSINKYTYNNIPRQSNGVVKIYDNRMKLNKKSILINKEKLNNQSLTEQILKVNLNKDPSTYYKKKTIGIKKVNLTDNMSNNTFEEEKFEANYKKYEKIKIEPIENSQEANPIFSYIGSDNKDKFNLSTEDERLSTFRKMNSTSNLTKVSYAKYNSKLTDMAIEEFKLRDEEIKKQNFPEEKVCCGKNCLIF